MRGICPNCEKVTELTLVQGCEEVNVRGEAIPVNVRYYRCHDCGEEFADPQWPDDPLEMAYREYRVRHSMLQPEDIREFRQLYGLSQKELSELLGWGAVSLSRYENGALQSEAHERALRLAMQPRNLLGLVQSHPTVIPVERRASLVDELNRVVSQEDCSLTSIYEERFGSYAADEFSGHRKLNLKKVFNAILYFCSDEGAPKTKINKLLFYADFGHCKDYAQSITGLKYVHLPYGPVPDRYAHYLAILCDDERALRVEERVSDDYAWEVLVATRPADLGVFATSEQRILATVKEHFENWNASAISHLSHEERGYAETRDGDLISYEYARFLRL